MGPGSTSSTNFRSKKSSSVLSGDEHCERLEPIDIMQAVIVSFDSLAANSLGCFGNEWVETPNWDRLAANGAAFDRHFCDALGTLSGMSWSTGRHPLVALDQTQSSDLGSLLKAKGIHARLVVSDQIQKWQQGIPFDDVLCVQGQLGPDAEPDKTPFAEVVKAGISVWNESPFQDWPRLLWLHSTGPGTPPAGFNSLYFEDFEERGQQFDAISDDVLASHPAVYAGAVSLIDHWLGELLNTIEPDFRDEPTLVIVMAARGHLWQKTIPSRAAAPPPVTLVDQVARTPLVLKVYGDRRFSDLTCIRSDRLVQTSDLVPTLFDWFCSDKTGSAPVASSWLRELTEENPQRPLLYYSDDEQNDAVRTQDWLCIRESSGVADEETATSGVLLFAKPEDLWDVNDIASQQPDVVNELLGRFPVR